MKKYFLPFLVFIANLVVNVSAFGGDVYMPVIGSILEQSGDQKNLKYIVNSDSTKAYAPIDGSVYYVGNLQDYGLSVIIKNAHRVSIIGNLDRAYVVKNQYLLQHDSVGSVAYHSNVTFIVQQIRRKAEEYSPKTRSYDIDFAKKFQDKILAFTKNSGNFIRDVAKRAGRLNYYDVASLLKDSGFPEKSIPTMYCIAKWESGLNPKAINFNTNNTVDVGLFQINSTWFKKCNTNLASLYDEKENSQCALTVYKNQGFPAWTTYNKYKNNADYCTM